MIYSDLEILAIKRISAFIGSILRLKREQCKKAKNQFLIFQVVLQSSITPIKSKGLKYATSVIKFIGLRNKNALSRKVLSHTFSENFRTLFVHFAVNVNEKLIQPTHNFNDAKNGQMEQKENKDSKQRIVRQTRCDIYRKTFDFEQKKKSEESVTNHEVNRYILLRE
ncbi:hypothetical protein RFI_02610 [Reticulomyxa filosa]|uniref:Uncharacterized protein n=1 Tax=Reticulomyxa filosa TaxID=46433 RepID=X6P8P4_RETFI|nr:hypothetical protein RFI_02610 [Reticulomyxa filosa]|eukprot:ETO34483.1 hypothetical protein RFI_02610 [Reticulomyxa filosa]